MSMEYKYDYEYKYESDDYEICIWIINLYIVDYTTKQYLTCQLNFY